MTDKLDDAIEKFQMYRDHVGVQRLTEVLLLSVEQCRDKLERADSEQIRGELKGYRKILALISE